MISTAAALFDTHYSESDGVGQHGLAGPASYSDLLGHLRERSDQAEKTPSLQPGEDDEAKTASNPIMNRKVISLPQRKAVEFKPTEFIYSMQEWDGYVTEVGSDVFIGMLSPVGQPFGNETERLEYSIADLNDDDRAALRVGSVFRLSAGYTRKMTGNLRHSLGIYFRPAGLGSKLARPAPRHRARNFFKNARIARPVTDADQAGA